MLRAPPKRLDKVEARACEIQGELERHFHFDRAMRFISSAILRIRSRTCLSRDTLSSSDNRVGGAVIGGNGRKSGTIQISMATSNETPLAQNHHANYFIIHYFIKVLLKILNVENTESP